MTFSAAAAAASASVLTPVMLSETFLVPCAAYWVLRVISWVAAPCSCDRGRDRGRDLVDLADDAADALDGVDGFAGDLLDVGDLLGNLVGRLRGLAGQRLDLGGHHGKAAAGFAGARRLDGRVQRQQVGLRGDGVDQADHFADPGRRFRQALHGAVGFARLVDGAAGDAGGVRGLLADVVDRGAQFLATPKRRSRRSSRPRRRPSRRPGRARWSGGRPPTGPTRSSASGWRRRPAAAASGAPWLSNSPT